MPSNEPELTLDPADWGTFRVLAHRMVDDSIAYIANVSQRPAWQTVPEDVSKRILDEPLPRLPQGDEATYGDFVRDVFPFPNGNLHPRHFGWVQGTGTPLAAMADMLASTMDAHLAGYDQSPALVEKKVIAWLIELMGFPSTASGILESGGTMANILGLAVARQAKAGFDIRKSGLQSSYKPLTVYCSAETHGWIQKGVELLGIGTDWLRKVPVNDQFQIKVDDLRQMIEADREDGSYPICVVGTAGTVNTGATDDLNALADLCEVTGLWFHVDGAFGALARLSPALAPIVKGIERADSVAFDLHKWMCLPFEIACLLVRDDEAHRATFAFAPSYIAGLERGVIAGGLPFSDRGVDLTRGFKALKAWMCMKSYGVDAFAQMIEQNVEHTRYLVELVEASPELELLAPVPLNVVCLRYRVASMSPSELDDLNLEILLRIQEAGIAIPSSTLINGTFAIRVCNVNQRTRKSDITMLVDAVLQFGRDLTAA